MMAMVLRCCSGCGLCILRVSQKDVRGAFCAAFPESLLSPAERIENSDRKRSEDCNGDCGSTVTKRSEYNKRFILRALFSRLFTVRFFSNGAVRCHRTILPLAQPHRTTSPRRILGGGNPHRPAPQKRKTHHIAPHRTAPHRRITEKKSHRTAPWNMVAIRKTDVLLRSGSS